MGIDDHDARILADLAVRNWLYDPIIDPGMARLNAERGTNEPGHGDFARLIYLALGNNEIGDEGVAALATAFAGGALPKLQILYLSNNVFGDAGLTALANTFATNGVMAHLVYLYLFARKTKKDGPMRNTFGAAGLDALADAIAAGALPSLKVLYVCRPDAPRLKAACEARGIQYS
eukprot:3827103-Prymnesium_polylepis.1